jgi:hypothetical protein
MTAPGALQITAVPLAMAAALLSKAGPKPVTVEMLESTIGVGAPQNPDGTLNLIHYAAWLVREISLGH